MQDRVSVYIQANDSQAAIRRIREAEDNNIQHVWLAMGGAGFADILTVLAAAAVQTQRITLGTSIVPSYSRHPVVMAQQALAIHDLAPDRLRLGVGTGNPLFLGARYGIAQTAPLKYLREYMTVLRGELWEGKVDYHGEFFQIADSLPRLAPIPLMISALGLKAFRLAGEVADGAITSLCPVSYLLDQALPTLRAGAAAMSRPAPRVVACLPVVFSTDAAVVSTAVSRLIQMLMMGDAHRRMFTQAGWAAAVAGDQEALKALALSLAIHGTEIMVHDQIQALLAQGLDEVLLLPISVGDASVEQVQLFRVMNTLD